MRISEQVKSVTFLKNNTSDVIDKLVDNRQPFIITQNGEAKAVMMNVHDYDEKIETIAMLKRLVISAQERDEKNYRPFDDVVRDIRAKYSKDSDGK